MTAAFDVIPGLASPEISAVDSLDNPHAVGKMAAINDKRRKGKFDPGP
jgi:hypothetical protein